jgi:hypothetical protein
VLARLRKLAPNGVVAVATVVASASDPIAAHLDLVLRSTAGNYPLPSAIDVQTGLRAAGFDKIDERGLAPGQPLRAFIAS